MKPSLRRRVSTTNPSSSSEWSSPNRYFAILKAIAAGNPAANEIAQAVGIDSRQISTYTQKLERLRLIDREVPITEGKPRFRSGQ